MDADISSFQEWQQYIPSQNCMSADERWMAEALKEAYKAYLAGEVPVGAIVVHDGSIIGRGYNQVELLQDATAHAEMLAIGAASEYLGNWRLEKCTLYSTLEPCLMCAGAILLARIPTLVWGAPDIRHGANGSLIDVFSVPHPTHTCSVQTHILPMPCEKILKSFFKMRRENKE